MRSKLSSRVASFIAQHRMIRAGDRVGVAVSGGADSVALLFLLVELQKSLGINLCVLHLNHKLRGPQSDDDESFVRQLASSLKLEFFSEHHDVASRARQERRNLEEFARTLRLEFFKAAIDLGRATRVAVAHSSDDQAETVLAHLLRGTGLSGLSAIHPVTRGSEAIIIRPLLDTRRPELRDYLRSRSQTWREDPSNLDISRMRARIRHKLLPLLENEFQPGAVANLSRFASLAREDSLFWNSLVEDCYQSLVEKTAATCSIAIHDLLIPVHFAIQSSGEVAGLGVTALTQRLIRRILAALKSSSPSSLKTKSERKQVTSEHVAQVIRFAEQGTSGHEIHLPAGITISREFDRMIFSLGAPRSSRSLKLSVETTRLAPIRPRNLREFPKSYEYDIVLDSTGAATVQVIEIGSTFRLKVIDWPPLTSETRLLAVALDQALLRPPLLLRNWRPGDSYRPQGRKRTRKLKRLLLEKRVGLRERAGWPVITSAGALVWARGLPVSAEFAPRRETKASLVIAEEAQ